MTVSSITKCETWTYSTLVRIFYSIFNRSFSETCHLKNTPMWVLEIMEKPITFTSVFHRILDFKTGLDFYPGPFFIQVCLKE